ncbi:MAG: AAA family ATPase [bacterium]|nr:AAA family ATPase [bacterium]MCY3953085.1 AAA family ATPase [bacterium]MCY4104120.1 AAA family ATPase [bacterium]
MPGQPVLIVVAGPNGAGKTTFAERVASETGLEFVNADVIAAERWPGDEADRAYEAAAVAAARRAELIATSRSFATETVFSHRSKVDLVRAAVSGGYLVHLHAVMVPEDLAVARVGIRARLGGHDVPAERIRARYRRLWALVAEAAGLCAEARFYDNSSARHPFRPVAEFDSGMPVRHPDWPDWAPPELLALTR